MKKENGGPAFPFAESGHEYYRGMSLRDYFAAAALQGLLANPKLQEWIIKGGGAQGGFIEDSALAFADAMLKARGES